MRYIDMITFLNIGYIKFILNVQDNLSELFCLKILNMNESSFLHYFVTV